MTTLTYLRSHVIPVAYVLLPAAMVSTEATAMLLAIALQESQGEKRRQIGGGPARGFWQFERDGGVAGVIAHHASRPAIGAVLDVLRYPVYAEDCYRAIEHNDVLAACFARLLLWTDPRPLPAHDAPDEAWDLYMRTWRPGKPHPERWADNFARGWALTMD